MFRSEVNVWRCESYYRSSQMWTALELGVTIYDRITPSLPPPLLPDDMGMQRPPPRVLNYSDWTERTLLGLHVRV